MSLCMDAESSKLQPIWFCCVLTICFVERSVFFDAWYSLALNGAITVRIISDLFPHVTHRQMQFIDKWVFTRLHLTSQEFLHAAADAVQGGLELHFEQSLNAIEIRPQPSENANRCRMHFSPATLQESGDIFCTSQVCMCQAPCKSVSGSVDRFRTAIYRCNIGSSSRHSTAYGL